ncbi:MAG: hypothetical protein H7249_06180 [Chitinophagaceae bacterium]|nr:hypothetical protein [Oligoflexus sp.]
MKDADDCMCDRMIKRTPGESGFGIIESLLVLAIILMVTTTLNQFFTSSRDEVIHRKGRIQFAEDMVRLMMVTEENDVCSHLSIANGNIKITPSFTSEVDLTKGVTIDNFPLIEPSTNDKLRYRIKRVTYEQISTNYASYPSRARAVINVYPEYRNKLGKILTGSGVPDVGHVEIIVAGVDTSVAGDNTAVKHCFAAFSRRIACTDRGKHYDENAGENINCN